MDGERSPAGRKLRALGIIPSGASGDKKKAKKQEEPIQEPEPVKVEEARRQSIFATEGNSAGVAVATGQTNKKRTLFGN